MKFKSKLKKDDIVWKISTKICLPYEKYSKCNVIYVRRNYAILNDGTILDTKGAPHDNFKTKSINKILRHVKKYGLKRMDIRELSSIGIPILTYLKEELNPKVSESTVFVYIEKGLVTLDVFKKALYNACYYMWYTKGFIVIKDNEVVSNTILRNRDREEIILNYHSMYI